MTGNESKSQTQPVKLPNITVENDKELKKTSLLTEILVRECEDGSKTSSGEVGVRFALYLGQYGFPVMMDGQ